jgi:hypothetical protein
MAAILRQATGAVLLVVLALTMGACSQAVPEYNLYVQAFNAQFEQGEAVLDVVAQSERTLVRRQLERDDTGFDPDKAAYYLNTVDPPITGSIRASLKSLKAYNDALGGLASGEAAEALANRIGVLVTTVTAGIAATGIAVGGPAASAGGEAMVGGVSKALTTALPIFKLAATAASREAFRQQLVAGHQPMRDLLVELRNGTPVMYRVMQRSLVRRGSLETPTGRGAEADATLEKHRQLLAAWVILLDRTLVALDAAVEVARSGGTTMNIAGLTEASIELRVLAEQMKATRLSP